jgi:phosphoribosylformylglycinamidine synthase subunit PurS
MRAVVEVMLKPEILDPQGEAIAAALPRLGFSGIRSVRQGKRFEIELDDSPAQDVAGRISEMAGTLLANPVIEDFTVHVRD